MRSLAISALKKGYLIGDGLNIGKGGLPEEVYLRSYQFSECRPVRDLIKLWKENRKFHKHYLFEDWLQERDKIRKSDFELGLKLGHDFVPHVHQEMCDMFVQKNFDDVYKEGYTLADVHRAIGMQPREKEMLLLAPRGSYKSTVDCVDCVSWIINAPDSRQLIIGPEHKLSQKFLKQVKGYFYQMEGADPSPFQALFPEFTLDPADATTDLPLTTPARLLSQEGVPSLWTSSVGSSTTGHHVDRIAADDAVDSINSETPGTREKLRDKWDNALNLVDEWGFVDMIGTRYYPDDLWGTRIAVMNDAPLKFLKRAAWTIKSEFEGVPMRELKEHMVTLYFPEKLTFKSLKAKLVRNERVFRNQQLNEPSDDDGTDMVNFTEDAMRRAHMPADLVPKGLKTYITFDTSSGGKYSDWSWGAVGMVDERGRLFSVDNVYGRWLHSEIAMELVKLFMKYPKSECVMVEDFPQSELFKKEISRLAGQLGLSIPLYFHKPSHGLEAKKNRIKGLEILLAEDRLAFVSGVWTDELMKQFTQFTGEPQRRRHDDGPDAIAYLQFFMENPGTQESSEWQEIKKKEQENQKTKKEAAHIFQAPTFQPITETPSNPMDAIFGGNGLSYWRQN